MPATLRVRNIVMLPLLVLALVLGTFALGSPADAASRYKVRVGMKVAVQQKGDPYRYGAAGPSAFDCSGLLYYSFRKAGIRNIPRTSDAQARFAKNIRRRQMRRGDLVFFHRGGNVYHVGLFAGWKNGSRYVVHAPYGNQRVHRERIWTNSWFPGTLRG